MRSIYKKLNILYYFFCVQIPENLLFIICAAIYYIAKLSPFHSGFCYYGILENRKDESIRINNIEESIIDAILNIICNSFDINPVDKYKIRKTDSVIAIYKSWYGDCFVNMDDCELERFLGMLNKLTNSDIPKEILEKNIGEIIIWTAKVRNNRPVSLLEMEHIANNWFGD